VRRLKELARSYLALSKDLTRVMNRIKALYRSWAIPCSGQTVYTPRQRAAWLAKLPESGIRRRAERLYEQLDQLRQLRLQARQELVAEGQKQEAAKWLRQVPYIGPLRTALLIALLQTPQRFRTKRQLWAYCGLALRTRSSADYRLKAGQLQRSQKPPALRGLNENHNHELKNLFKATATVAVGGSGPFHEFYAALIAAGKKPAMARLTLARKIAAITLSVWKKGARFDPGQLKRQAT